VDDKDYQVPFRFAGKLDKLTVKLEPTQLMEAAGDGDRDTGTLKVDGNEVSTQKVEHTDPLIMQWDESMDFGSDTGTPVDDQDYQCPFTFTGKFSKITLKVERPELSPEEIKKLENAEAQALDGAPLHRVQGGPH
jgi:arylsulfatase